MDANTAGARAYLTRVAAPLALTALHALEVRNAFQLGIFRKLLTAAEAAEAWSNLQRDLRDGRLLRANVKWPPVLRLASLLSEKHSATAGTRSLDIIHVASARIMRVLEFVSFDVRQRALASAIGLKVAP